MTKQGIEGRVEIKIEKVGEYFVVDIEDTLSRDSFFKSDYIPKKKVCHNKEFMIGFIKKELNSLFKQFKKGEEI